MSHRLIVALGLLIGLAACSPAAEKPTPPAQTSSATPAPTAVADDPTIAAALAALPVPYNEANYANGRKVFAQCRTCHTLVAGGANQVGPNLHAMFGRPAGAVASFKYSTAVKDSAIVWDAAKLDAWLADPKGFLPGNRMAFVGVKKPDDRRDLIGYLKVETAK